MIHKILGIHLTAFALLLVNSSHGNESVFRKPKMDTLSICAIIKNEAKYLNEWIEFHRLVGVDHFYLYNNKSVDRVYKVLTPYIKKGIVTLVNWPDFLTRFEENRADIWALSTQIPAYENAIKFKAVKKTKWLALLNTDEFLLPVEPYTLKELLEKYDSYPAIILTTDVFDAASVNLSSLKRLVIESHDLVKPPHQNILKSFNKLILKPDQAEGFVWPPYQVIFKDGRSPIELKRSVMRINRYINRDKEFIDTLKHKLYADPRLLAPDELSSLLEQGYAVEDQERAIFRYLPALLNKFNGAGR